MARRRRRSHCPCGQQRPYTRCCAPIHAQDVVPDHPTTLVRARYCAFVRQRIDFIIDTTDPDGDAWQEDDTAWRREIARFSKRMTFVGLRILHHEVDGPSATVDFLAGLRQGSRDVSFQERSHFRRRDGHWLYHSGAPTPAQWPSSS